MKTPNNKAEFAKYLKKEIARIERCVQHPAGLDQQDLDEFAETVNEASMFANRLGAGNLASASRGLKTPAKVLEVLGGLLAWCREGKSLTTEEVASELKVSPDKILDWVRKGELLAINTAKTGSSRPKYRFDPAEVEKFKRRKSPEATSNTTQQPKKRRLRLEEDEIAYF